MKNITQATENRIKKMVKNEHRYGECFEYLLNKMKEMEGFSTSFTITEIKEYFDGEEYLKNETQVEFFKWDAPLLRGLEYAFPNMISVVDCLNLHYVNVSDFNKLVKCVFELPENGYCDF